MISAGRSPLIFVLFALVMASVITRGLAAQPSYTDAYYYFNAAERLADGRGLTDEYLWTYIGAPQSWPEQGAVPSHLYWMPFTSLVAAFGMWVFNAPGDYYAAQWPFALMLAGAACVGFWLGGKIGGTNRHRWVAGLLVLFSGFFTRFWGATDTFAPYALVGSLALVLMGLAAMSNRAESRRYGLWLLAGVFSGLGHLTRADGLLLLIVGWAVILWPFGWRTEGLNTRHRMFSLIAVTLGYLLVMSPWFARNLDAIGTPLPVGGMQAIWFTEYNDLFNYPPEASPERFFADDLAVLLSSRWEALVNNLQTFIAVEGLIVMTPLMLIGLWVRRRDGFLRAFWLYALGLHVAMTLVFPYPGYRGGLFHSAAALIPWWAALGVAGVDTVVEWTARRRRWKPQTAKAVFSGALVVLAVVLSFSTATPSGRGTPGIYSALAETLPADARVMINDPAALYYYTGLGGVVLPNAAPDVVPEIAVNYQVTHLLLEFRLVDGQARVAAPGSLARILDAPPMFLSPVPFDYPGAMLYEIR
jgi:hypothetical protein